MVQPGQAPQAVVCRATASAVRAQVLGDEHQHAGPVHPTLVVLVGQQDPAVDGPQPDNDYRPRRQHSDSLNFNLVSRGREGVQSTAGDVFASCFPLGSSKKTGPEMRLLASRSRGPVRLCAIYRRMSLMLICLPPTWHRWRFSEWMGNCTSDVRETKYCRVGDWLDLLDFLDTDWFHCIRCNNVTLISHPFDGGQISEEVN